MILPAAVKPGDTIGVMAPSSRVQQDRVDAAAKWLEAYGFRLKIHPQTFAALHQSAGTAQEKAEAFHDPWSDPEVTLVMAAGGGNRAAAMLPLLDMDRIAATPKPLVGYSDVTVLLNAITAATGLITFHGPSIGSFTNATEEKHLELFFNLLAGRIEEIPMWGSHALETGSATGRLVGGNLSVLTSLLGTRWQPDFAGAILFIEDAGDELSRYDRMLRHLANAGVFDRLNAVIVGDMRHASDNGRTPFGFTLQECLGDAIGERRIPIVTNAPFGHGVSLVTMPIGANARLFAENDREIRLVLDQPPVC